MKDWDPKSLWDEFRKTLQGPVEDDDEEQSSDPSFFFHMMVTAPLVLMLVALARR